MKVQILNGQSIPNIPWQDRPENCTDVVWRYDSNPVIKRDALKCSNSIFNSAVVPFEGGFAGVFRVDDKHRAMELHAGFSDDGINWKINEERIEFVQQDPSTQQVNKWLYGYDPRVCFIEDRYWVTWCNAYNGQPTIGVAYTYDFKTFTQCENAFLPFNRNGVLFPRKIDGKYLMLSRPSDSGHTPFGDIYLSQSPDMKYWGEHRHVMAPFMPWESKKIGAGPIPIETSEGWLCFYHGVLESCNGFVYSFSACILDAQQPWKVKYRCAEYLINPREIYECVGDVPNVTFPCAALCDKDTGKIAIYYGCADTVVGLCFTTADEVVEYIKEHSSI
ncbi:MAG: glycoside hydrolase family 130 protein [Ruminococcus sp.]|nr:glycoside hydrolase family 130 protein [Ruminococcus sp.]MBQ4247246.1 glycoside hydrolase family 130 protein [Ruminococcus sp.]